MIDDKKLNHLLALAEKATPGERSWAIIDHGPFGETEFLALKGGHNAVIGVLRGQIAVEKDDAVFIASCSPETIRALIEELKELRFRIACLEK